MLKILVQLASLIALLIQAASVLAAPPAPQSQTGHFVFYVYGNVGRPDIDALANTLERSFDRIASDLNAAPSPKTEVHIYADRWRYGMATGNLSASGSIEGVGKLHFVQQAWSQIDNQKVALHEFTHAVTLKLLLDLEPTPLNEKLFDGKFKQFPIWLWEAVATYEAGELVDPKSLGYMKNGAYPKLGELSNKSKGGKIYQVGYTITEYILQQYGKDKLLQLIASYGDLASTLGVSEDEFSQAWHRFVQEKYLSQVR